jgi:hypothetical protein
LPAEVGTPKRDEIPESLLHPEWPDELVDHMADLVIRGADGPGADQTLSEVGIECIMVRAPDDVVEHGVRAARVAGGHFLFFADFEGRKN